VPNRTDASQTIQTRLIECFGNVPHRAFETQLGAIGSDNATRLLASMLKRVQTEVSQTGGFEMSINSENTTLFTQLVVIDFSHALRLLCLHERFKPQITQMKADMASDMMRITMHIVLPALLILVSVSWFASANGYNARTAPQLYRRYCVSCHGDDGRAKTSKGKFSHARDLSDPQWHAEVSDERVFNSIMNGRNVRGNMPAFSKKLSEQEANSLVDFVRRLKVQQQ